MASTNAYRRSPFIQAQGAPRLSEPAPLRENQAWPVLPWTECPAILRITLWCGEAPPHELLKRALETTPALACRTPVRSHAPIQDSALAVIAQSEKLLHRALTRGEMRIHAG